MKAILASNSCYCRDVQLVNQGRTADSLGFSRSVVIQKLDRHECKSNSSRMERFRRFRLQMQQTESPMKSGTNVQPSKVYANGKAVNLGTNGKPMTLGSKGQKITMVPISEAVNNNKALSKQRSGTVNGSIQIVNGTSIVKREITPPLIKSSVKVKESTGFPPEEYRILPSDESFKWANENYSSVQRSIDVWSFVLSLRVRVLLDNAKWAYLGSFTKEKQV